jgi:hypothetical protein
VKKASIRSWYLIVVLLALSLLGTVACGPTAIVAYALLNDTEVTVEAGWSIYPCTELQPAEDASLRKSLPEAINGLALCRTSMHSA